MTSASVVVVAAGGGSRLGLACRKAWVDVAGRPLWWHATRAVGAAKDVSERVLVLHPDDLALTDEPGVQALLREAGVSRIVAGGSRRQDSVRRGVEATDPASRNVLVHDAARPLVRAERVAALLKVLEEAPAALLAAPVAATVKLVSDEGEVVRTIDRSSLRLASTPQGGRRDLLLQLLARAEREGFEATDEAALFEWGGTRPRVVEDLSSNLKVTTQDDLELARAGLGAAWPRVGHGYDIHRLVEGGPLILGGARIPCEWSLQGHSDGDCLLHAVMEACLGAAGLPDIGEHFPDSEERWRGADSSRLLALVLEELANLGLRPIQVDCSVVAERPRLGLWKATIKESLAVLLSLPADRVAVKARSGEGLDSIGRGEALAVYCTAVLASLRSSVHR